MKRLAVTCLSLLFVFALYASSPVIPQTRERTVTRPLEETVKVDVDLVVLDALVMQKKTGRVVGNLKKDDFLLSEDGVGQLITHFSQDTFPLSVILLVDRGGCLDPFGEKVRAATLDALGRLRPQDEVALMAYYDQVDLIEGFGRDPKRIAAALDRMPPAREEAAHCLNKAFYDAAQYMIRAGNPVGRRVIIVITGVTSNFDCPDGPSSKEAAHAVYESGSVVCGLIPKSPVQRLENGISHLGTRLGGLFKVPSISISKLADETGGEVMDDKPENLDRAFNTLMEHLRTRYSIGFVSSNKKRDGSVRKLKLELAKTARQKQPSDTVVKTRRNYVAPKG